MTRASRRKIVVNAAWSFTLVLGSTARADPPALTPYEAFGELHGAYELYVTADELAQERRSDLRGLIDGPRGARREQIRQCIRWAQELRQAARARNEHALTLHRTATRDLPVLPDGLRATHTKLRHAGGGPTPLAPPDLAAAHGARVSSLAGRIGPGFHNAIEPLVERGRLGPDWHTDLLAASKQMDAVRAESTDRAVQLASISLSEDIEGPAPRDLCMQYRWSGPVDDYESFIDKLVPTPDLPLSFVGLGRFVEILGPYGQLLPDRASDVRRQLKRQRDLEAAERRVPVSMAGPQRLADAHLDTASRLTSPVLWEQATKHAQRAVEESNAGRPCQAARQFEAAYGRLIAVEGFRRHQRAEAILVLGTISATECVQEPVRRKWHAIALEYAARTDGSLPLPVYLAGLPAHGTEDPAWRPPPDDPPAFSFPAVVWATVQAEPNLPAHLVMPRADPPNAECRAAHTNEARDRVRWAGRLLVHRRANRASPARVRRALEALVRYEAELFAECPTTALEETKLGHVRPGPLRRMAYDAYRAILSPHGVPAEPAALLRHLPHAGLASRPVGGGYGGVRP